MSNDTPSTIYLEGEFTWDFGMHFFIETSDKGNWEWEDPDYGGDGKVKKIDGDYSDWIGDNQSFGRRKGIRSGTFEIR